MIGREVEKANGTASYGHGSENKSQVQSTKEDRNDCKFWLKNNVLYVFIHGLWARYNLLKKIGITVRLLSVSTRVSLLFLTIIFYF